MKTETKKTPSNAKSEIISNDVLEILHDDHQRVAEMFFQFSEVEDNEEKEKLVLEVIKELLIHAKVEEEIVYPAVREAADDAEELMDEADTEHEVVKFLLSELENMSADDDHFKSRMTVLKELVNHHVQEEEKEMFEKLRQADTDLDALGEEVLNLKTELAKGDIQTELARKKTKAGSRAAGR